MQTKFRSVQAFALLFVALLMSATPALAAPPANVAGKWTFAVTGGAGNAAVAIEFVQNGAKITGTFKGPRQSGPLAGTVDGNAIKFHVSTRVPMDYTGTVDGDSMKGTMSGNGKTGDWTASRVK